MVSPQFFNAPATEVAQALVGKLIRRKCNGHWLVARIIETEAYELNDRASHSSLGYSPSRAAMFDPPGTIYMYYARGADSLNFSVGGPGDAVLIKSAIAVERHMSASAVKVMQRNNPGPRGNREIEKLCAGQTLLCRSLNLNVPEWNRQQLDPLRFDLGQDDYKPSTLIQCRRLGIPKGRDEDLLHRYVDETHAQHCTSNPLSKRAWREGQEYRRILGDIDESQGGSET